MTLLNFVSSTGADPCSALIQAKDGNLYSTTDGAVFQVTTGGMLKTLHSFNGMDGYSPYGGLIQAKDGSLYGTTSGGGVKGYGTVYRITTGGTFTSLYSFTYKTDGALPYGGLIQAKDGNFYGTTTAGGGKIGAYGYGTGFGTVFRITTNGILTILHFFDQTDGDSPYGGLIQATDGNLYGTTYKGGANSRGTVFRITTGGKFKTLYSFSRDDGAAPYAALIQGRDGDLYGTTINGGYGTVFRITTGGVLTTLHFFSQIDGDSPYGGLIQAKDGNLYGTTYRGGTNFDDGFDDGTVFQVTTGGTLKTLHSFNGMDGYCPYGGLIQAKDGSLYGTTAYGGSYADATGTIYRLSLDSPLPKIVLTKATTLDAKSVTVDYTISTANVLPSLRFDFYRSDKPVKDASSKLIGTKTLSTSDLDQEKNKALNIGTHTVTVQMISGTPLVPDPDLPYVVVVVNANDAVQEDPASVNTIYFRKYLIGFVVHGFSFNDTDTIAWTTAMANDLMAKDHFDGAYPFYWLAESVAKSSGETIAEGKILNSRVTATANTFVKHAGDVVDVHFIGHSRGTVVTSQALLQFVNRNDPALLGSYIEVTLLDIHPANTAEDNLLGFTVPSLALLTATFQALADDPEVILPAGADIMSVDVWYQQTPSLDFPASNYSELAINLWGESQAKNKIKNDTVTPILWQTSLTGWKDPILGMIGHTEIHEYYRIYFVDTGLVH